MPARQQYLSGEVYCWVALDRAVRLAPRIGAQHRVERGSRERERICQAILTQGWSVSKRAFAQAFDSDELDAAALLVPLVGLTPRSTSTAPQARDPPPSAGAARR